MKKLLLAVAVTFACALTLAAQDAAQVRATIAAIRAELSALEATLPPEAPVETGLRPSPTGRDPRLLWTPRQQYVWERMRLDYEAGADTLGAKWFGLIRSNALGNRYGDTGIWATLMYQMTGDPQWVAQALRKLETGLFTYTSTTGLLGNTVREYGMEYAVLYDWLYPGLTDEQRTLMRQQIDVMFTFGLTNASLPVTAPIRTNDSDQVVGMYFGLAFYHIAAGDHHPRAAEMWAHPQVGGYVVTGNDRVTLRNALASFMPSAAGGEWIESGQYNLGTMKLLVMGHTGLVRARGQDDFPEVTAWLQDAKFRTTYMLTPDFADPLQWGDDDAPRGVDAYQWVGLSMLFNNPVTNEVVHNFVERLGATGTGSAEPALQGARGFFTFDPYAARTARTTLPLAWWARGQGILSTRTSWAADASLLFTHFPQRDMLGYVDHTVNYHGDVQFYRKGAWALTHPIGYGGKPNGAEGVNSVLVAGMNAPIEFRGAHVYQSGPGYAYVAGTVGGDISSPTAYYPPPSYFHEGSRSVVWLPGEPDTLIVFDRIHADDPRLLTDFARYSTATRATMTASGTLKQVVLHMPVSPTIEPNRVTWPGVVVDTFDNPTFRIVNESTWTVFASERKFHVRLEQVDAPTFSTALMVIRMGDATGTSLEHVSAGDVRGVLVHRAGQPDVLALFNAAPGPKVAQKPRITGVEPWPAANQAMLASVRQRTTGYTVGWTASTATTEVLLPEANGAVERVVVTGAGAQSLTR
jgi:hypothetical protein